MSARVIIDLLPSGRTGHVYIQVSSEVTDGGTLTQPEIEFTLEQVLAGLRSGDIKLREPTTVTRQESSVGKMPKATE
jgi:hypothetical protein